MASGPITSWEVDGETVEAVSDFIFWFNKDEYWRLLKEVGLKLNIQKTKIMASGPITSWKVDGETVEAVSDFIFGAPKSLQIVTAAMKLEDTYSLEGKL